MNTLATAYLIAAMTVSLYQSPGSGRLLAELDEGVRVETLGKRRGRWINVRVDGEVPVEGWIDSRKTGCRVTRDTILFETAGGRKTGTLRKGALVRMVRERGGWLSVVVSIRKPSKQEEGDGSVLELHGVIENNVCSPDVAPFMPQSPSQGMLTGTAGETSLYTLPDKESKLVLSLPARMRFVVLQKTADGWARGYLDEALEIHGWLDAGNLGPVPVDSPLEILSARSPYDHEFLLDAALSTRPGKKPFIQIRAGTAVRILEIKDTWYLVETRGPVRARGWVESTRTRKIRFPEDSVAPLIRVTPGRMYPRERGRRVLP